MHNKTPESNKKPEPEVPPIRARDALEAMTLVMQWEEQQEDCNMERLEVFRRQMRRLTHSHTQNVQETAKQQTLDGFLCKK